MSGTVLIFSGGDPLTPQHQALLPLDATVIGADSGIDRARDIGVDIDIAIGDFDSVTAQGLAAAERAGSDIRRYPSAKDATDLELAIAAAIELDPDRILLVAMSGGRPDHEMAGLLLLASPDLAASGADVDVLLDGGSMSVVYQRRTFTGRVGDLLSLVPVGGGARGVTTNGLEYPLANESLEMGTGRGVSNVFAAPMAVVTVTSGVLFAFLPGSDAAIVQDVVA